MEAPDKQINDSPASNTENDAKEDVIQVTSSDLPEVTNSSADVITSVPRTTEAELSEDNSKEKTNASQEAAVKDTTKNGIMASDPSSNESQTAAAAAAVEAASDPSVSEMEAAAAAAAEEGGGRGVAADGCTPETNVKERLVRKLTGEKFSVTCCLLQ